MIDLVERHLERLTVFNSPKSNFAIGAIDYEHKGIVNGVGDVTLAGLRQASWM